MNFDLLSFGLGYLAGALTGGFVWNILKPNILRFLQWVSGKLSSKKKAQTNTNKNYQETGEE